VEFKYIKQPVPRLSRSDKSAETRKRVLDAALSCLIDLGYARTSTSKIAERAGLSRGAQIHHFPKKEALLAKAVEHLFEMMFNDFRDKVAKTSQDADRQAAAVDILWKMHRSPMFRAWLELAVASRTDKRLRAVVRRVNERFNRQIEQAFRELFPRPGNARFTYGVVPFVTFFTMAGMAIETIVGEKAHMERSISDTLRFLKEARF
jgi:AcrR family transcriptional regulator